MRVRAETRCVRVYGARRGGFSPVRLWDQGFRANRVSREREAGNRWRNRNVRGIARMIHFDSVARTVYSPSSGAAWAGRTKYRDASASAGIGSTG
jgi:hypothetical protein